MDKVLVLDFGGQYNQLIARRVREQGVYAEVRGYNKISLDEIVAESYSAIIFTGGPNSAGDEDSPHFDKAILDIGVPILGICYGHQLLAWLAGGKISSAENSAEYGKIELNSKKNALLKDVANASTCWMSHKDYVSEVPNGFEIIATTENCPCAAFACDARKLYGVQFHPEVTHTEYGKQVLHNFLFDICSCTGDWNMGDYLKTAISKVRKKVGNGHVLLALSGGVDSSVCAALLAEAIGRQLTCVFVDHGLMRKNEGDEVEAAFEKWDINFVRVDASRRFIDKLSGVCEPEKKRKIIGEEFIRVFEEEAGKIGKVEFLAQGTIYPDVIESGLGASDVIKSHHNVGGLPENIAFGEIIEPLRLLFKDEVRKLGRELGLADYLVQRQPFPGPGLAIRILGEVTDEKLDILRETDAIFREEMANFGRDKLTSQYFTVLTNARSVGVMGDARTYGYTIAIRAVTTDDFMTADWARLPYELLEKVSSRITNEVKSISRVVYDITSKPPATVEWE